MLTARAQQPNQQRWGLLLVVAGPGMPPNEGDGDSRGGLQQPSSLPKEERGSCTAAHCGQGTTKGHASGSTPIEVRHYTPGVGQTRLWYCSSGPTSPVPHTSEHAVPCMRRGQTMVEAAQLPPRALPALLSQSQPAGVRPAGAPAPPCQVRRPPPLLALERVAVPHPPRQGVPSLQQVWQAVMGASKSCQRLAVVKARLLRACSVCACLLSWGEEAMAGSSPTCLSCLVLALTVNCEERSPCLAATA